MTQNSQPLVAIDLGSNSFHLIRAERVEGQLQVRHREKIRVRLAAGLDDRQVLDDASIERAMAAFARFNPHLTDLPSKQVRIVATHTLRKAKNVKAFLKRAKEWLPHPIEIISGLEEARLTFDGVAYSQAIEGRAVVVDIGGGSTEFALGDDKGAKRVTSRSLGCVVYTERFFDQGTPTPNQFSQARMEGRLNLERIANDFGDYDQLIGSSGTAKACSEIIEQITGSDLITLRGLNDLEGELCALAPGEFIQRYAMSKDRYDVLGAGVAILQAVFEVLGAKEMRFSKGALREGVLLSLTPGHETRDIRGRTVEQWQRRYTVDQEHAARLRTSCSYYLDAFGIDDGELRAVTLDAASLCEIGQAIHYSGYHRHSAYLLAHGDMPGYHRSAQDLLANLVGAHRKRLGDVEWLDSRVTKALVALRLAVMTHLARREDATNLGVALTDGTWELSTPGRDNSLLRADLSKELRHLSELDLRLSLPSQCPA